MTNGIKRYPVDWHLRAYRRERGLTQAGLAGLLGVSQGTVSRWEKGWQRPDRHQLGRIAELLNAAPSIRPGVAIVEQAFGRLALVEEDGRVAGVSLALARAAGRTLSACRDLPVSALFGEAAAPLMAAIRRQGLFAGAPRRVRGDLPVLSADGGVAGPCATVCYPLPLDPRRLAVVVELDAGPGESVATPVPDALVEDVWQAPPPSLVSGWPLADFYRLWLGLDPLRRPSEAQFDRAAMPDALRRRLSRYRFEATAGRQSDGDGRDAGGVRISVWPAQIAGPLAGLPADAARATRLRHLSVTGLPYLERLEAPAGMAAESVPGECLVCPLFDDNGGTIVAAVGCLSARPQPEPAGPKNGRWRDTSAVHPGSSAAS
jgi:transcriptional regulator with XRE-family HTH domain